MSKPAQLTPVEAYEAVQRILAEGDTISLSSHARQRMRERRFTLDDIRHALITGTVSAQAEWDDRYQGWKYKLRGRDSDGEPLALVIAIEPALARITVITGF